MALARQDFAKVSAIDLLRGSVSTILRITNCWQFDHGRFYLVELALVLIRDVVELFTLESDSNLHT